MSVVGLQNPVAYTLEKLKVLHQIPEQERFELWTEALTDSESSEATDGRHRYQKL